MKDETCISFLRWALPQLHMRWHGYRKVRGQVCKRIDRRIRQLHLQGPDAYRDYLQSSLTEWRFLDRLCRITISRFYRDQGVYDFLGRTVMPQLAQLAIRKGESCLNCWSAGCASGEEAYTLVLLWNLLARPDYPDLELNVIATDIDPELLERAATACYQASSLKELPDPWLHSAFHYHQDQYCLREEYRQQVQFHARDLRSADPGGRFHLVLCRNLAFTYYDEVLQQSVLKILYDALHDDGALVIGAHETLPKTHPGLSPWEGEAHIFRRTGAST